MIISRLLLVYDTNNPLLFYIFHSSRMLFRLFCCIQKRDRPSNRMRRYILHNTCNNKNKMISIKKFRAEKRSVREEVMWVVEDYKLLACSLKAEQEVNLLTGEQFFVNFYFLPHRWDSFQSWQLVSTLFSFFSFFPDLKSQKSLFSQHEKK